LKYFSVFLPMLDSERSDRFQTQHLEFLRRLKREGRIYAHGQFTDGAGELVIYQADSYEQVESCVRRDPYVIEQVRDYEVHEWEMVIENQ